MSINKYNIDTHTHILQGIDDGSEDIEMSIEMLQRLINGGTRTVILTPHFYPNEKVEDFLEHRDDEYKILKQHIEDQGLEVNLIIGAEVLISSELPMIEEIEKLCIEGTKYMLVELPYGNWPKWIFATLQRLIDMGITPVMAHIERYIHAQGSLDKINRLASMDVLFQMNAYSLTTSKRQKLALKLIKKDMIHFLGSDLHKPQGRASVSEALDVIEEKFGEAKALELIENSEKLIKGQVINKRIPKELRKFLRWYI